MAVRKPNWFSLPNEVTDVHLRELSSSEVRVILVLFRETRGWQRDAANISISDICEKAGLGKSSVSEACSSLQSKGLIRKTRQTATDGAYSATRYEVDFEDEIEAELEGGLVRPAGQGVVLESDKGSPEIGQGLSAGPDKHKEEIKSTKENIREEEINTPTKPR